MLARAPVGVPTWLTVAVPAGAALVDQGIVKEDRADDARQVIAAALVPVPATDESVPDRTAAHRPRMAEVAAYAGAALVIVAIVLLGVQYWGQWRPAIRSAVLGLIALVLLSAGVLVARLNRGRSARAFVATMVLIASIAVALAVGTYVKDTWYSPPNHMSYNMPFTVALAAALMVLIGGYLLVRTSLLILLLAVVWGVLTETRRWREETLGGAITAVMLIIGCQMLLGLPSPGWAQACTFAAAFVLFGLYWAREDWPSLGGGVLALTTAVTEALVEWTDGSLGAGGAVLVAGLTLLAASGGAVLLRRRREAESEPAPAPRRGLRHHTG